MNRSRTPRKRIDPLEEALAEHRAFVEEVCRRLERAAGASGPVLDRHEADELIGRAHVCCGLWKISLSTPHRRQRARREIGHARSRWKRVDRAVESLEDALLSMWCDPLLPPPADPAGRASALRRAATYFGNLADSGDPMDRVVASIIRAVLLWRASGPLASRWEADIPRGRPRNPVAPAVADVLVPLWQDISNAAGVWRDGMTRAWRGPLLEVAEWFAAELAARHGLPVPSAATLARALRAHPKNRPEKAR